MLCAARAIMNRRKTGRHPNHGARAADAIVSARLVVVELNEHLVEAEAAVALHFLPDEVPDLLKMLPWSATVIAIVFVPLPTIVRIQIGSSTSVGRRLLPLPPSR